MKFCQIYKNKAWWIFEADTMPVFAPDIVIKDITNVNPQPEEGWDYDPDTDTFSVPVPEQPEPTPTPSISLDEINNNQLVIMGALADMYDVISSINTTTTGGN